MPCQYLPASENSYHGPERGPGRGFTQPRPYAQHIHAREGAGSLGESGGREGGWRLELDGGRAGTKYIRVWTGERGRGCLSLLSERGGNAREGFCQMQSLSLNR